MKVVIQSVARFWGGTEKWVLLVARGLSELNHEVLFSCRPGSPLAKAAAAQGFRVTHERPGGELDVLSALRFAHMLRKERPDVLLLTNFKRTFWAAWAARLARVPRVVECLGQDGDVPRIWFQRHAFKHYVDSLIVVADSIRDHWLKVAPWYPAHEVHVVYSGVDTTTGPSSMRQELGIAADVPLLAAAGTLEPRKGFDVLLHAFAGMKDKSAQLMIAGSGVEAQSLRDLAGELGIAERIHWLGFRKDMKNVLRGADIFALPSRREGMAWVMLEAMAAGCLMVATDISGVQEAIGAHSGRTAPGWIVPPDDSARFAEALDQAVRVVRGDDGELSRRREENRYRIENWFSIPRMLEEAERVLTAA